MKKHLQIFGVGLIVAVAQSAQALERWRMVDGFLGIQVEDQLASATGAFLLVKAVTPGSPAAASGLRVGDKILRVDKEFGMFPIELIDYVAEKGPGSSIDLVLADGEKTRKKTIFLSDRPRNATAIMPSKINPLSTQQEEQAVACVSRAAAATVPAFESTEQAWMHELAEGLTSGQVRLGWYNSPYRSIAFVRPRVQFESGDQTRIQMILGLGQRSSNQEWITPMQMWFDRLDQNPSDAAACAALAGIVAYTYARGQQRSTPPQTLHEKMDQVLIAERMEAHTMMAMGAPQIFRPETQEEFHPFVLSSFYASRNTDAVAIEKVMLARSDIFREPLSDAPEVSAFYQNLPIEYGANDLNRELEFGERLLADYAVLTPGFDRKTYEVGMLMVAFDVQSFRYYRGARPHLSENASRESQVRRGMVNGLNDLFLGKDNRYHAEQNKFFTETLKPMRGSLQGAQ